MINLAHRAMYLARQDSNEDVRTPALHMGAPIIRGTFLGGPHKREYSISNLLTFGKLPYRYFLEYRARNKPAQSSFTLAC